jgi:hypothetical protein
VFVGPTNNPNIMGTAIGNSDYWTTSFTGSVDVPGGWYFKITAVEDVSSDKLNITGYPIQRT